MTIEKTDYPGQFTFYDMKCAEHGNRATCVLKNWDDNSLVFLCDVCLDDLRDEIARMTGEADDAKKGG